MRILHLSDMHFGFDISETSCAMRKTYMNVFFDEIRTIVSESKLDYIIISGDIGWHATSEDYNTAKEYIDELLKICGLTTNELFICPGNHDVERRAIEDKQFPTEQGEADKWINTERLDILSDGFRNYISFCENIGAKQYRIGKHNSYLVGTRSTDDLCIICLNSAWYAQSDEVKDMMWVGNSFLHIIQNDNGLDKNKPTIAIVHHPSKKWHEDETSNFPDKFNTFNMLCKISDLILSGHTHEIKCEMSYQSGAAISGTGAVYDSAKYTNSFYVYNLDSQKNVRTHYYIISGSWEHSGEESIKGHRLEERFSAKTPTVIFNDFDKRLSSVSHKSVDSFIKRIYNTGAQDGTPIYSEVNEKDNSYEMLSCFTYSNNARGFEEVSQSLKNKIAEEPLFVLRGLQGTGKSSVMSLLYIDMLNSYRRGNSEYYPIYLDLHVYMQRDALGNTDELSKDIENILEIISGIKQQKWIIFLDGVDTYESSSDKYEEIASRLIEQPNEKIVLCIGKAEDIQESRYRESIFEKYTSEAFALAETRPLDTQTPEIKTVIKKLELLYNASLTDIQLGVLNKWFADYCNKKIDFRSVLILYKLALKVKAKTADTLSDMLITYYKDMLIDFNRSANLEDLASDAVEYIMGGNDYQFNPQNNEDMLIHKNKLVRDFLLSYYFVRSLQQRHFSILSRWRICFTKPVNHFICDFARKLDETYVKNLITLYDKSTCEMKINIGYLLGRSANEKAKAFLKSEWQKSRPNNLIEFHLYRTLSVSLICFGETTVEDDYLQLLLDMPDFAKENLLLHCHYFYGTGNYITSKKMELDTQMLLIAMSNLKKDINNILKKGKGTNYSKASLQLDIFTYFSLLLLKTKGDKNVLDDAEQVKEIVISNDGVKQIIKEYARNCVFAYRMRILGGIA